MSTHNKSCLKIFTVIFLMFLSVAGIMSPVSADMGPKPSISLTIINAPESDYYVALFWDKDYGPEYSASNRLSQEENALFERLVNYSDEGYHIYKMCHTYSSLEPDYICRSNEKGSYYFYYQVPSTFKVVIMTSEGEIYASKIFTRSSFNADITYDAKTGVVIEQYFLLKSVLFYLFEAIICFAATVGVELLLMFAFRYPIDVNAKALFIINAITQVILNAYQIIDGLSSLYGWLIVEAVIIVIEALWYLKRLKNRAGEAHKAINVTYAVCANLVSMFFDIPILLIFKLLFRV